MDYKIDVKRVQKRLLEMAVIVRDIFDRHDIPYFICAGTLLGALRNKGFIPWDDDFDLYCFDDYYDKALEALNEELPKNMFLEYWGSEPNYFHSWAHVKDCNTICANEAYPQDACYTHKGLSVDIYRYVPMCQKDWPEFKLREAIKYIDARLSKGFMSKEEYDQRRQQFQEQTIKRQSLVVDADAPMFGAANSKFMQRRECILPLSEVEFEGYVFKAPNHPNEFLTKVYGDYMKLPPESQRVPHYSDVIFNQLEL